MRDLWWFLTASLALGAGVLAAPSQAILAPFDPRRDTIAAS